MEYFKKLEVNELFFLEEREREDAVETVIRAIEPELNRIVKASSLGKKMEQIILLCTSSSLCKVLKSVVIEDVFNGNMSFVVERLLERAQELKNILPEEQEIIDTFTQHIVSLILVNPSKAFKSRGTNHVIRKILVGRSSKELVQEIESFDVEYFLSDKTRATTYTVYLDVAEKEAQAKGIDTLVSMMEPSMLRDYLSFLYQKVCELSSETHLDTIFEKISPEFADLACDPIANYFIQTFITCYNPEKAFSLLLPVLHTFKLNNNVLLCLCKRACGQQAVSIVEYLIKHIYGKDLLMKRLIFNEDGGFDSKTYRVAVLLLSVNTAYLEELQLECISLYEKYWLFNKIGQKLVLALLQSNLNREILQVFVGVMKKELLGLRRAKGGIELLSAIKKVADPSLQRHIRALK
ncbi:hypothetical protein NECID01_1600 [Nematocida sp. AWRm77]|nr:hypothetical protein NECID01_1600 [Nematocida sp. AWRm77]